MEEGKGEIKKPNPFDPCVTVQIHTFVFLYKANEKEPFDHRNIDYAITTDLAVIVFLRSGPDSTITPQDKKGKGLSDAQCAFLRDVLYIHSNKRKIIVMHHPAVNAIGTNSDGTPFTGVINSPEDCSIANNRTSFLNICDSNHVDVVLNGHEHQNVVANRNGKVIPENGSDSTRYIQTAAAFNRLYRIITVDPDYVTVSAPMRSCNTIYHVNEANNVLNMSVFPNLASDKVTIECPLKANIEILTIDGLFIQKLTTNDHQTTIDLSALSPGIYLVKAETGKGVAVRKVLKQ